ncbi:hypothetical protein BHE74_00013044, partial [Ensete ventricosum]
FLTSYSSIIGRSGSRAACRSAPPRNPLQTACWTICCLLLIVLQLALHPHQLLLKEEDRCLAELAPQLQMVSMTLVLLLHMLEQHYWICQSAMARLNPLFECLVKQCINNYESDISKCQFYMDMLNECRWGSGAASR